MTPAMAQAFSAKYVSPALFVEIHFISEVVYTWSGNQPVTWNGHVWIGVGYLGSISTVEEGSTVEAKGIVISLSGIPADTLTDVLTDMQQGLPAIVYLGCFDDAGTLIPDPLVAWSGKTDQPTIDMNGETATLSINCESRLVEMNVAVDRRYTNEDQQMDYPGDRGLEFQTAIQDARIFWGQVPSSKNNL